MQSRPPTKRLFALGLALALVSALAAKLDGRYAGFVSIFALLGGGAAMTPAALVLLAPAVARIAQASLGLSARLGVDNVSRELGRSALTACALVLATSLSLMIACYSHSYESACMAWVERSIPADIFVTVGSPIIDRNSIAFSPDLALPIREVDGVEALDFIRSTTVPTHGLRIEMLSLESPVYLSRASIRVIKGPDPIPVDALSREPAVLIAENFARRTGLGPGDTIDLPSPTGAHRFKIVATIVDYSSDQGWLALDRRYMTSFWGDPRVESVDVYLKKGADPDAVAAAIRKRMRTAGDGMFVTTNREIKGEIRHVLQQTFQVSQASEVVALAVAVLGVIGTMLAAVLDRLREIGVMRAIGTTRRQILMSVMAEAGFLGLASAIVGFVVSVPAGLIFVRTIGVESTGWSVPFEIPTAAVVRTLAMVISFSILSGALPGLRAARMEITRALAYE